MDSISDGSLLLNAVDRFHPEVILLDVSMPQMGGLEALRRLRAKHRDCKIIVLTMHADARLATAALKAGATGFVPKESSGDELLAAIDAVLDGHDVPDAAA